MKQPSLLPLKPATQADDEAGRADLIAAMSPAGRERALALYNDPQNRHSLQWKSQYDPRKSSAQLAAEKKNQRP